MRIVKHLGARSVPADDSKVLMLVPLFPGEKLVRAEISGYFASGDDSAIDQPGELNWYGLTVPWQLVFATKLLDSGGSASEPGTVGDWDILFRQWLKGADDDYWGGDVDADPEEIADEEGHDLAGTDAEELIHSGPIGPYLWYTREALMEPLAAEGNTIIRFGDVFRSVTKGQGGHAMGSVAIFGMVRFEHAAETNFNVEFDDATSREAMGLLLAGDYTKVNAMVHGNTGALGDYLRTVLYGGDNYIEADTLKGPAGKAVVKGRFVIDGPLSRVRS